MTRNELAETITRPAEKTNLAFEPGLVETILDDVTGEPGSLPLLEFLLETLWGERRGTFLHYDAYQKLGRVAGAIAHRAEEIFTRELDDNQRQAAQRLLIRMVRPGEGVVGDTRRRAAMPEADLVAEATIRRLADARLVVTEQDPASGRKTVELAHEALIRGWQRLRGWVDQDREFLRTRERIAAQARLWEDEGKPSDRLLPPGRPLAEGKNLLTSRGTDLDPELIAYIEASGFAAVQGVKLPIVSVENLARKERPTEDGGVLQGLCANVFVTALPQADEEYLRRVMENMCHNIDYRYVCEASNFHIYAVAKLIATLLRVKVMGSISDRLEKMQRRLKIHFVPDRRGHGIQYCIYDAMDSYRAVCYMRVIGVDRVEWIEWGHGFGAIGMSEEILRMCIQIKEENRILIAGLFQSV